MGCYIGYITLTTEDMAERDRSAYLHAYNRRPDVKAKSNEKSKRLAKARKLKNTFKRIEEHSIVELMKMVKEKCDEKDVDYESVRAQYEQFMRFLHDPVDPE